MAEWAIIFDVDGVLLELTRAEEDLFFAPFARRFDARTLSRDWNSYLIRNDEDIVQEIVERRGLNADEAPLIIAEYLALLRQQIEAGTIETIAIPGAGHTLQRFAPRAKLGIATANFREAAMHRLIKAGLWQHVKDHAHGADGGGHKHEILARNIASLNLPQHKIIYVGDNVNDVVAGLTHQVHFIGFSTDAERRRILQRAGAIHLAANHAELQTKIDNLMDS